MDSPNIEDSNGNSPSTEERMSNSSSPSSSSSNEDLQVVTSKPGYTLDQVIKDKLIMLDEMDRLNDELSERLRKCGWRKDIQDVLKVEIGEKTDVKFKELYDTAEKRCQSLVPNEIREDMLQKLREFCKVNIVYDDEPSSD